jgi:hypothetical protein
MKIEKFNDLSVTNKPNKVEEGVFYVHLPDRKIIFKCPCGCGETIAVSVNLNQRKTDLEAKNVSLFQSISNPRTMCGSRYMIKNNKVIWLPVLRPVQHAITSIMLR